MVALIAVAEEIEHHRPGPNGGDRVGDIFTVNIRRRPVNRFEQRREIALRIEIGRRRNADSAGTGRAEIGENIAEQVGADHHVKTLRLQHEAGTQDIDMLLVPANFGIVFGHLFHPLIPVGHADRQTVGFGCGGQRFAWAAFRQFEGVAQDPVHAAAGKDRLLNHHFMLGAFIGAAAKGGIFAFGIFAHHVKINIAGLFTRQRAGDAGEQAHRAQVDVLIELAAELQQRPPQRNVVGNGIRPADGAEVDSIEALQLLAPVVRHHLAIMGVIFAACPLHLLEAQRQIPTLCGGLQHANPFRQNFFANSVTRDGGNTTGFFHSGSHFLTMMFDHLPIL